MRAVYSRGSWNSHWNHHMRSRLLILRRRGDMQSPVCILCDYVHTASQKLNNVTFSNKLRFNCNPAYAKKVMFLPGVWLSVCFSVCLFNWWQLHVKATWANLYRDFATEVSLDKEAAVKFWIWCMTGSWRFKTCNFFVSLFIVYHYKQPTTLPPRPAVIWSYLFQGHRFWYQSNRTLICDFLL